MKELEEKADKLVEKFKSITSYKYQEYAGAHYSIFEHDKETLTQCAIQSVNHTIYTLKKLKKVMAYKVDALNIEEAINEQIELKKILEGRL
jgi:hypothetical protein